MGDWQQKICKTEIKIIELNEAQGCHYKLQNVASVGSG